MTSIQQVRPECFANAPTSLSEEERAAVIKKVLENSKQASKLEKSPDVDTFEKPVADSKKRSKSGSALKAAVSFFLPGLGQACEGRFKDGLKDFGVAFGVTAAGVAAAKLGVLNFAKAVEGAIKTPYGWYASIAFCALAGIAQIATRIHSAVDAYNGGKKA